MHQTELEAILRSVASSLIDGKEQRAADTAVFDLAVALDVVLDGTGGVGDFVQSAGGGEFGEGVGGEGGAAGDLDVHFGGGGLLIGSTRLLLR